MSEKTISLDLKTFISGFNYALVFVFLFFLTLSTDLIHLNAGFFQLKLTHIVGCITCLLTFFATKKLLLERNLFLGFLWILSSILISSAFSLLPYRSISYGLIFIFVFVVFFVLPINLMLLCEEQKLIKLYIGAYFLIGSYAALQFFASLLGIVMPFSVQQLVFTRGSGFSHEPSFYALYAIPIVSFMNARGLLLPTKKCSLFFANLFLLVSTSTTALLSYMVFFAIMMFFKQCRKKLLRATGIFVVCFGLSGMLFFDFFKTTFFKFFFLGLHHESFTDRLKGIISSVRIFWQSPFFGTGLGGVAPDLYKEEFFPHYDGPLVSMARLEIDTYEPTNVCTEILGSLGLFGLLAFLFLLVLICRKFRQTLQNPTFAETERVNTLCFIVSTIVMLICLQINQGLFRAYIWTHLGLGLGYAIKIQRNRSL